MPFQAIIIGMSHTHHKRPVRRSFQPYVIVLGILSVASSFSLGVRTAGDIQPIVPSQASDIRKAGDMDNDGTLSVQDAIEVLEIAQGYAEPSQQQLLADPNGDGKLTVDDALHILHDVTSR